MVENKIKLLDLTGELVAELPAPEGWDMDYIGLAKYKDVYYVYEDTVNISHPNLQQTFIYRAERVVELN